MLYPLLLIFGAFCNHVAFYVEAYHFVFSVSAYCNRFTEVAWKFTCSVIRNGYFAAFSRLDGFLRILRYGASASGYSLMYDKRTVSGVGEFEFSAYIFGFLKRTETVGGLVEFDFGRTLSYHRQYD